MPHPKRIAVVTFAAERPAALVELTVGIDQLLIAANVGPTTEQLRPLAIELQQGLTWLSQGVDVHLSAAFSLRQRVIFNNLKSCVLSKQYHLRLCQECRNWFLATDARRQVCASRPACAKAVNRRKATEYRKRERAKDARAKKAIRASR